MLLVSLLTELPVPLNPISSVSTAAVATVRAPARLIPSCYHHLFETRAPSRCSDSSHKSRIGLIAMYCKNLSCIQVMYNSTYSNPASLITYPKGGHSQITSCHLLGFLPISRRSNLWWNPPSICPTIGFTIHVYNQKRRTAFTTSLNKLPVVCEYAPSLTRVLEIQAHFFL